MKTLLDRIKEKIAKEGLVLGSKQARDWLTKNTKNLRPDRNSIMKDTARIKNRTFIGRMYFFFYDPKHKETLPYYDKFPLVIPIERYMDGFLGLNLHYISPKQRLIFMDKLYQWLSDDDMDDQTRLRLNYQLLSGASRLFEAQPCLKRYLFTHIKSRFLEIPSDEWEIAARLPFEFFEGATKEKVFRESRNKF